MKHLQKFEGKNTKHWYSILASGTIVEFQFNKLLDYEIEDAKFFYNNLSKNLMILAYMSKAEHDKYFKKWVLQDYNNITNMLDKLGMIEIVPEEWIENYKLKLDTDKYNL